MLLSASQGYKKVRTTEFICSHNSHFIQTKFRGWLRQLGLSKLMYVSLSMVFVQER